MVPVHEKGRFHGQNIQIEASVHEKGGFGGLKLQFLKKIYI
jgi:hypothetical protein